MECLVDLFRPFQEATEILCAEKYVTISFVVPFFDKLRDHLAAKDMDNEIIKDMKKHMLLKLNTRYSASQINFLSFTSLLDIRYKQKITEKNDFNMDLFTEYVVSMCQQDTVVRYDNSSPVRRPPSKRKHTRFLEFEDDKV